MWSGPFRSVEGWEELQPRAVTLTMAPGDVLIFDSWLVHCANGNSEEESKTGFVGLNIATESSNRGAAATHMRGPWRTFIGNQRWKMISSVPAEN